MDSVYIVLDSEKYYVFVNAFDCNTDGDNVSYTYVQPYQLVSKNLSN